MSKAKNVWKMTYVNVILRTSGFGMVLGASLAVLVIGAPFNWINLLAGFIVLVLMQGLAQHSLDTVMDKSPVENSAFRKFASKAFTTKELLQISKTAAIISAVVVVLGVVIIKHYLIVVIFLLGLLCIYKYAQTNIEWYAAFAFAACSIGGYLTQVDLNYTLNYQTFLLYNMPICTLFFFLFGFYKIGQVLYRTDDYYDEICKAHHIQYARRNLRLIHHLTQFPLLALLFAIMGYQANVFYYSLIALILVLVFYAIWFATRHTTCNKFNCKCNAVFKAILAEKKEKDREAFVKDFYKDAKKFKKRIDANSEE